MIPAYILLVDFPPFTVSGVFLDSELITDSEAMSQTKKACPLFVVRRPDREMVRIDEF